MTRRDVEKPTFCKKREEASDVVSSGAVVAAQSSWGQLFAVRRSSLLHLIAAVASVRQGLTHGQDLSGAQKAVCKSAQVAFGKMIGSTAYQK